jgi:hypothetical protein
VIGHRWLYLSGQRNLRNTHGFGYQYLEVMRSHTSLWSCTNLSVRTDTWHTALTNTRSPQPLRPMLHPTTPSPASKTSQSLPCLVLSRSTRLQNKKIVQLRNDQRHTPAMPLQMIVVQRPPIRTLAHLILAVIAYNNLAF